MIKCLLCSKNIAQNFLFSELFLLKIAQNVLCSKCQKKFEKIPDVHCTRCYKPNVHEICTDCQNWEKKGQLIKHQAIFQYNQAMRDYFSQFKFIGDYRLYKMFEPYFKNISQKVPLVPIPISPKRLEERGFNQVTTFLQHENFIELLEKENSVKQSSLNRKERLESPNTFRLKKGVEVPSKLILIDDIYTTGTTLFHTSQILKEAGAQEITSFSLCR
jgi:competence protein ComFC